MPWRITALGSFLRSLELVGWRQPMASCKAHGPSGLSKPFGRALQCADGELGRAFMSTRPSERDHRARGRGRTREVSRSDEDLRGGTANPWRGLTCGKLARAQEKTIRTRTLRVDISIKGRAFAMCFTQQSGRYYQVRTRSRFTYSANQQKKCSSIFLRMKG